MREETSFLMNRRFLVGLDLQVKEQLIFLLYRHAVGHHIELCVQRAQTHRQNPVGAPRSIRQVGGYLDRINQPQIDRIGGMPILSGSRQRVC